MTNWVKVLTSKKKVFRKVFSRKSTIWKSFYSVTPPKVFATKVWKAAPSTSRGSNDEKAWRNFFKTFFALPVGKLFFAGKVFICTRYAVADIQKKLFLNKWLSKNFFFSMSLPSLNLSYKVLENHEDRRLELCSVLYKSDWPAKVRVNKMQVQ